MEILSYSMKWLELTLRWGHVLFAILWVGNSFLFNYLDNKLEKNTQIKEWTQMASYNIAVGFIV